MIDPPYSQIHMPFVLSIEQLFDKSQQIIQLAQLNDSLNRQMDSSNDKSTEFYF
jgi:hypothetical protein